MPGRTTAGRRRPPDLPLRVLLLGELGVWVGDRLVRVDAPRVRSVLGNLILHPDSPHSRQRLAFLLWPDSGEAQARTNLRKVLHTLRHELPELDRHVVATPRTIVWQPSTPVWVDAAEFQAAAERAHQTADPDEALEHLHAAAGLYRGDLLEGNYDEWITAPRERLRAAYASVLRRIGDLLAGRGDHPGARRFLSELVRLDPLDEASYRSLMLAHAAAGDRAGGVRVYHECARTLGRELGIEPSEATREVYESLTELRDDSRTHQPVLAGRRGGELVGRDAEWARLTQRWRHAEDGRAGLVVVTGEPGIGKTRLVDELATWCAHRGAAVGAARSYAAEGELGYGAVAAWLRSPDIAPSIATLPADAREVLARLVPDVAAGVDGGRQGALDKQTPSALDKQTPGAAHPDEAETRRRLIESATVALISPRKPLLLVADDAQWIDRQSLAVMTYLLRAFSSAPVLVVATVRREDLEESAGLAAALAELYRIDGVEELALGRLGREHTAELGERLGHPPDGRDLYEDTEGIPLFVVELVSAAREATRAPQVTPKLQAVIRARLDRCSDEAAHVLGVAAVAGRAFDGALVGEASGLDDVSLVRALDELWRRGLIREHARDQYDFSHGRLRDVAYDALSPPLRTQNHLRVGRALAKLAEGDEGRVAGRVAAHFDDAGRPKEAVVWYQRAAVEAQEVYAYESAERLLERARTLALGVAGNAGRRLELEILTSLPTVLTGVDGYASERVADAQRRAIDIASSLRVEPEAPLVRSLVLSSLCARQFDEARELALKLLNQADGMGDVGLGVESQYLLGVTAFWDARIDEAASLLRQVAGAGRHIDRREHLVRFGHDPAVVCRSRLANTLWLLGRDAEARRVCAAAISAATQIGDPVTRRIVNTFAAVLFVDLGDTGRVRDHADALGREPVPTAPTALTLRGIRGYLDVVDGRTRRGLAALKAAIAECTAIDPAPGTQATIARMRVTALSAAEEPRLGVSACDEALALPGTRLWEAETRRQRAVFLRMLGAPDADVDAALLEARDVAVRQGAAGLARIADASRAPALRGRGRRRPRETVSERSRP